MAVFDTSFIIAALQPERLRPPIDPVTEQPVTELAARVEYLLSKLDQSGERVVIPTPALAEFLVHADTAAPAILSELVKNKSYKIADFGRRATVEASAFMRADIATGDKRGGEQADWQKIKVDIQVVAIAKVESGGTVFTGDRGLANRCRRYGLMAKEFAELDLPPDDSPPLLKRLKDEDNRRG